MKKKLFPLLFLAAAFATALIIGCDDSGNSTTNPTPKTNPNIQFKLGAVYTYYNDSIPNIGAQFRTRFWTFDSVAAQLEWVGKPAFQINSVTKDSVTLIPVQNETFYVSYDANSGQFYQWGIKQLLDPGQTASWDLVADFSKALGTSVSLFTITNLFGNPLISANVSSTVKSDTIFTTAFSGISVKCYYVEVVGDVLLSGVSIGKVYLDYFIGYTPSSNPSNPSGRIRVRLRPISLPAYQGPGFEQYLRNFSIP